VKHLWTCDELTFPQNMHPAICFAFGATSVLWSVSSASGNKSL
jgi:hypothetical protein